MFVKVSEIALVPELDASAIPAITALDQVIVPIGLLAGVYVKISPEHIAAGVSALVRVGKGLTTTVTVSVFSQFAVAGVVKV